MSIKVSGSASHVRHLQLLRGCGLAIAQADLDVVGLHGRAVCRARRAPKQAEVWLHKEVGLPGARWVARKLQAVLVELAQLAQQRGSVSCSFPLSDKTTAPLRSVCVFC